MNARGVYIVNDDCDLEGWTPESLTEALREALAAIGVEVVCRTGTCGSDGGFHVYPIDPESEDWYPGCEDRVTDDVMHIVNRIVEGA